MDTSADRVEVAAQSPGGAKASGDLGDLELRRGSQPAYCSHDAGSQQGCLPRVLLNRRPEDSSLRN